VEVLLDTKAVRVEPGNNRCIRLAIRTPQQERTLSGSDLLAAAGRRPNPEAPNHAVAGFASDARGFIPVDERLVIRVPPAMEPIIPSRRGRDSR
jgi:pyruvate/2-oxoglutarate dehydrogenase complex dihydrolipoamide dehydrogenase (E3) component